MAGPRRVLITGVGLVTPLGPDRETSWKRLLTGDRACRRLDPPDESWPFPKGAAGAPADFRDWFGSADELTRLGGAALVSEPVIAMALSAARDAMDQASLDLAAIDRDRAGCLVGTSKGGVHTLHAQCGRLDAHWLPPYEDKPDPTWWNRVAPSGPAAAIAAVFDLRAAALTPVTACATGLSSILQAAMLISHGECDVVLAGSSDASLTPAVLASFRRLGVLARGFDDPAAAVRPFDRDRNGFLAGEGAGIVVMESADHAKQRGARPLAEWISSGMVSDAAGLTQLEQEPETLTWLIRDVLRRGQVDPDQIDYISLHGTGTPSNDRNELLALADVFAGCESELCASSLKGSIGHLLGAAGSVEFASMLLAMRDGVLPPTMNLETPDPLSRFDLVAGASRERRIDYALKLSLGFGGHLVAGLVRRVAPWPVSGD